MEPIAFLSDNFKLFEMIKNGLFFLSDFVFGNLIVILLLKGGLKPISIFVINWEHFLDYPIIYFVHPIVNLIKFECS